MATETKKYTEYNLQDRKFVRTDTAAEGVAFDSISVGGETDKIEIKTAASDILSVDQGGTPVKIDGVATPTGASQAANKAYVDAVATSGSSSGGTGLLGVPPDGSYDDGLLTFSSSTQINDSIDQLNEVLVYLAPAQGYTLPTIDGSPEFTIAGTTRSSTPRVVGSSASGLTGVSYESTDTNGGSRSDFINDNTFTLATPTVSSYGWRSADTGSLVAYVNGTSTNTVNLGTSFSEAQRDTGQTSVPWTDGILSVTRVGPTRSFPKWQDGDATITIGSGQVRSGYNYYHLIHGTESSFSQKFWYSATTSPTVSDAAVNAAGGGANQPNTGSTTRYLSGVQFYNAGTYNAVGCNVNGVYGTTYPVSDLAVTSAQLSTATVNTPAPVVTSGSVSNPVHGVTNQSMAIQANQRVLLGSNLTFTFTPRTNYGGNGSTSAVNLSNILIDSYSSSATANRDYFRDETRRYKSDTDFNSISLSPNWDSSQSLLSGSGYSDGLQSYGGALVYPAGNFSSITAPAASPDYSGATGRRYYYREFYFATGQQNFTIQLTGVSATDLSAKTGSGIFVEMALPTQTKDSGGTFEFKDCLQAYTTDSGIGCLDGSSPSGSNPAWDVTAGTKSTADSGNKVIVKISYPQGSTKQISQIDFNINS